MMESAYAVKPHPLSIVIFSKDRAAQLDLCLKSIHENLSNLSEYWNIYIIYTSSSKEFEDGYRQLIKEWYSKPNAIYFLPESKFKGFRKTLEYCMKHWQEMVLFFTDDDIVYRKFEYNYNIFTWASKAQWHQHDSFCTSLRLGTNTFVQDQYTNSNCLIPDDVIMGEGPTRFWNWKEQQKDTNFAYPFSVDGHVFPFHIAKRMVNNTPNYNNPNSFEGKAQNYIQDKIKTFPDEMCCFEKSYVINTPLNRVQETCHNGAGKFFGSTPEELNKRFLNGERLTLEGMDFSTIIGVHQELKLCWGEK